MFCEVIELERALCKYRRKVAKILSKKSISNKRKCYLMAEALIDYSKQCEEILNNREKYE